ncbi:uncharacterized protein KIAA1257 homolog [Echinops telfairi]|uniref:Uncharacterized protein KIAA1257 homolog n=1 Tax=Echinops telfairi TaxID=9371 RepID=A0AC55D2U9_ECHTE|nr:uncharacterized protein KIAA1257 homolog [Echinops telfairi]
MTESNIARTSIIEEAWDQEHLVRKQETAERLPKSLSVRRKDFNTRRKSHKRRQSRAEETDSSLGSHWKQDIFSIQLPVMPLLAGWQTVTSRGNEKSVRILDCYLTLQTEVPIMNEEQRQELNPLIIKIKCASCLPSQPVPIDELERLCSPVYCRYQFYKTPVHETEGQPHGTHVHFQDINVILLGALSPSDLREYLEGPPMVVEVHDRDLKSEEYSRKPTLFGEDPLDACLNLQALISPKQTGHNPFESYNKKWNPYGVARVSFADLLLGHTYLNLFVPIHNCEAKPMSHGQDSRNRASRGHLQPGPMPMGNYLDANSLLKLRVDLAVPLRLRAEVLDQDLIGTQFGLIIFVFDSKNISLLHSLLQDITMINAKALDLDSYSLRSIQQILSAFKVRVKIEDQKDLDVLTGFHLLDGKFHLFILEGVADQALRQLWERHQSRMPAPEHGKYKVLYNSQLLFRHRLYTDLETILYHVLLFKPLASLLKHPQLYIRNAVPPDAFQALVRLHYICHHSTKLKDVVTRDLLPSSAMIKCLSQEFGMPISQEDLSDETLLALPRQTAPSLEDLRSQKLRLSSEIQSHQEKYLQWRHSMLQKNREHKNSMIQKNITEAYQVNKKSLKPVVKVIRMSAPVKDAVYNYSIQTLNSTELAKRELHREMAKTE